MLTLMERAGDSAINDLWHSVVQVGGSTGAQRRWRSQWVAKRYAPPIAAAVHPTTPA